MPPDDVGARPVSALEAHLGYWLRQVSNHVSHAFSRKVEGEGVTVAEWVILRELYDWRAGTSPSHLAARTGLTRGAVSKLVERLLSKGLVTRESVADDRRYQSLQLSPAAVDLVPKLALIADANDAECFDVLTQEERETLLALLKTISARKQLNITPID